ncbi:MAG: tRNA (adenosine(37)-N6)-threonylcarbamoyltransferase complex ATPase subunit type 1 TsaE [Planctomycetota bacterium]|nr:tRNA (adenosine(37)-N6)-threonylcarbamoyltransferase complex ATPase subunit type 1 TsaE [Planctomycetota bacterium]
MNQPLKAGYTLETGAMPETEALGAIAGALAPAGMLFALRGELGAGKTVFVRGLARGLLGKDEAAVTSPTYVLLHVYKGGAKTLYHIDVYRMKGGGEEFESSGLAECLADAAGVVCLEWPERVEAVLPEDRVEIEIEHADPTVRNLRVMATGPRSAVLVQAMIAQAGNRERLRASMEAEAAGPISAAGSPPSLS